MRARTIGATSRTAGHSPQDGLAVLRRQGRHAVPAPKLTPPLAAVPGMTSRMLAPMLAMVFWIAAEEPSPISIMAMTAPTPMTMPSVVSSGPHGVAPQRRHGRACRAIDFHGHLHALPAPGRLPRRR